MNKKRGILYWLKVIVAILMIFILMYRCSHQYGLTACAEGPTSHPDSTHSVTLSPAQTVALFGTQLQALIRTDSSQLSPRAITFDYAFPLSSIGYMQEGGGFSTSGVFSSLNISSQAVRDEVSDFIGSSDGLVYIASSSQWGSGSVTPVYPYFDDPAQLHIPFSISLSGISGIQHSISFQITNSSNLNNVPVYDTSKAKYLSGDDDISVDSLPGGSNSGLVRSARWLLPTYGYTGGTLDESQCISMGGFYVNTEFQEDSFDVTGITIDCFGLASSPNTSGDLWLVVQCPKLWSYNPPASTTTTRPAVTTSLFTYVTMPPAYTDTPQDVINNNLIMNNYQLDLIIDELNLIYAKLVADGELGLDVNLPWNPDLQDGQIGSFYNTDVQSQMRDIINGHTTATLPALSGDNRFVRSAFSFLWDIPFVAAYGALALSLSVASWIIFRGRGG